MNYDAMVEQARSPLEAGHIRVEITLRTAGTGLGRVAVPESTWAETFSEKDGHEAVRSIARRGIGRLVKLERIHPESTRNRAILNGYYYWRKSWAGIDQEEPEERRGRVWWKVPGKDEEWLRPADVAERLSRK